MQKFLPAASASRHRRIVNDFPRTRSPLFTLGIHLPSTVPSPLFRAPGRPKFWPMVSESETRGEGPPRELLRAIASADFGLRSRQQGDADCSAGSQEFAGVEDDTEGAKASEPSAESPQTGSLTPLPPDRSQPPCLTRPLLRSGAQTRRRATARSPRARSHSRPSVVRALPLPKFSGRLRGEFCGSDP